MARLWVGFAAVFLFLAGGCASTPVGPGTASPGLRVVHGLFRHPRDGSTGGMYWIWQQGIGAAVADCGSPWVAIAGGAGSSTATDVGTGFPETDTKWEVVSLATPAPKVWAYALCAPSQGLSTYFHRVYGYPTKKHKTIAVARCGTGDILLMGWGYGATSEGPLLVKSVPAGYIAGGSTSVAAGAECMTAYEYTSNAITVTKKSGGGSLYAACDGDGDDVIGGAFGAGSTGTGSSGLPERQYPGLSSANTLTNAPTGMWFFSKSAVSAWIACQEDY
jgi:hypothetical protein